MSLAVAGTKTEREKSVIDKSGDTLNIDYRFLHGFAKLRKLKKNIKNKIFWLILAGAIVTRVLNAYLKFWVDWSSRFWDIMDTVLRNIVSRKMPLKFSIAVTMTSYKQP